MKNEFQGSVPLIKKIFYWLFTSLSAILVLYLSFQLVHYYDAKVRPAAIISPAEITVYISGAVIRPGVYKLSSGSHVVDAINAAGGLSSSADVSSIKLTDPVTDLMQIVIYEIRNPSSP